MKNNNGIEKCEECKYCDEPLSKEDNICVCKLTKKFVTSSKMHPRCPFIDGSDLAFLVNKVKEDK